MSTLRVNNITDTSGGSSSLSVPGAAKAWVNFNGTGTVAIRAQMNVSSITDNGTGDYTVNFANAMTDANYATIMSTGQRSTTALDYGFSGGYNSTTTSTRLITWGVASNAVDWQGVQIAIFR
jgi:hypothetical protein